MIAEVAIIASCLFIGYTYLGYPLLICALARIRPRPVKERDFSPKVVMVISCYREVEALIEKLKSVFASDYPLDRLEVRIGLDAGTQEDALRIRNALGDLAQKISLRIFPRRVGKPGVLNELIRDLSTDVVVFSDARQVLAPSALRALVRPLADPAVGAVSGELVFLDDVGEVKGDIGLYWRYEKLIRDCESRFFSLTGATGAFYAMRSSLVSDLPGDVILDDVYQPFNAIKVGKRIVFQREAVMYDRVARDEWEEFQRKVRTLIGNFQLLELDPFFLSPRNPVFWQFLSHKLFRLFVPYAMVVCYVASALAGSLWTDLFFALQTAFYLLAVMPLSLGKVPRGGWSLPYTFFVMNLSAVVALVRYLKRDYSVKWR